MGHIYSESKQVFRNLGAHALNIIAEDEYGCAENGMLVYPNVNSCTTITVMLGDHKVYGAHLTVGTRTSVVEAIFNEINTKRGNQNVAQLCVVGVVEASGSGWKGEPKYSGRTLYHTLNETFGRSKTTPIFLHEQKFKLKGADYFHYRVICGHGVLGWYSKQTREMYPNVSIIDGFSPLQLQAA